MWSKSINKTILILGLLFLVLVVGVLVRTDTGREYFKWLGAMVSQVNPLTSNPQGDKSSDLNFSNINDLEISKTENSNQNSEVKTEAQEPASNNPLTIDEVQARVGEISVRIEVIEKEIKQITVYNSIQDQINQISAKTKDIAKGVNELNQANRIVKIQDQLSAITETASLLSQLIANSA